MELNATLWLYPMFLSLRLPIWKQEGKSSWLWEVCKQWPGCIEEILVGNGLAQMTSEGSSHPEMQSMVLGSEVE